MLRKNSLGTGFVKKIVIYAKPKYFICQNSSYPTPVIDTCRTIDGFVKNVIAKMMLQRNQWVCVSSSAP